MSSEFAQNVDRFRAVVKQAEEWSVSAQQVYEDIANQLNETTEILKEALRMFEQEREGRITAERNKERFRYALWVYLQERDGIAGIHAPTPETLKLIRDLIQELH